MGKTFEEIDEKLTSFIAAQRLFFVASAPLSKNGHVNVSPKGLDSFRVLSPRQVGYADATGSGVETIAHVRENGRLVIMFCAFDGPPRILRLHGSADVIEPNDREFAALAPQFPSLPGLRSIIRLNVERISDSCGYAVPRFEFTGDRTQLKEWAERKGESGLADYRRSRNAASLDGLPGLKVDR